MTESLTLLSSFELATKVKNETNIGVFSKQEILILEAAYEDITNRTVKKSCGSCYRMVLLICKNWLAKNSIEEVLTERVMVPTTKAGKQVEVAPEPSYADLNLAQLRKLFPHIKATSKKSFLAQI
jgi:hypothetical protein